MIELERSGRRAGFSTTPIVAFRDIPIASRAAWLPRPGGASQHEREAAEAGRNTPLRSQLRAAIAHVRLR
jgi:hypothetical protein